MNSTYASRSVQRRRHTVAGALLTILLVALWLLAAGVIGGRGQGGSTPGTSGAAAVPGSGLVPVASTSYVVQPDDTLWSVARSLQPRGDVRPLVDRLARHTAAGRLMPGDRIPLP